MIEQQHNQINVIDKGGAMSSEQEMVKLDQVLNNTSMEGEPCYLSRQEIDETASQIAQELNFEGGSDALLKIVTDIGGNLAYRGLGYFSEATNATMDAQLGKDGYNFEIILPKYTPVYKDYFSISHELGHLFLHMHEEGNYKFSNNLERIMT